MYTRYKLVCIPTNNQYLQKQTYTELLMCFLYIPPQDRLNENHRNTLEQFLQSFLILNNLPVTTISEVVKEK